MSKNNIIQVKNNKKFYIPKVAVIYFSESGLSVLDNLSKLVVEYVKFIQIGADDVNYDKDGKLTSRIRNRFDKVFYNWSYEEKDKLLVHKPSSFLSNIASDMVQELKKTDLVILVYKTNNSNSIEYVKEMVDIFKKNDILAFHYVIENFVNTAKNQKEFEKLVTYFTKKRQVYVPIKEESIVLAYKNASISNRNYFINLYVNNLIESFLAPFLDPIKNPDHFPRVKALFYQSEKNFDSKVVSTIGYSDAKVDNIDIALIKALSNPIFCGSFDASYTFLVNVKMPYFEPLTLERINYVLKSVVGEWKTFLISSYTGSYDYDVYCQISIMAINVDDNKLIADTTKIDEHIKKILKEVTESNKLFADNRTKELLLEKKIDILEDKLD